MPRVRVKLPKEQQEARATFRVLEVREWTVHHGGCLFGNTGGIGGQLTLCEARGVRFWVREHIRGNHFLVSGGQRLGMKEGRVPKGFGMVLEVAAPKEHLPWVMELVAWVERCDAANRRGRNPMPARTVRTHPRFTMETAPHLL